MRPFTIYPLHKLLFEAVQQQVVTRIRDHYSAEAIFLLGAGLIRQRHETIFQPNSPTTQTISDCLLLILTPDLSDNELLEWQQGIQRNEHSLPAITPIVMRRKTFDRQTREKELFCWYVQQRSVLLFDKQERTTSTHSFEQELPSKEAIIDQWQEGLHKSKEFLAGAHLFLQRRQYPIAGLMLHQSLEQSLRTFIRIGLYYTVNTHNLDKLCSYAAWVSHELRVILAKQNSEDKRLFRLLQQAYIESRYNRHFQMNEQDLLLLSAKVNEVAELLEHTGQRIIDASR